MTHSIDTTPEIEEIYRKLMLQKTPQQRFQMALQMASHGMNMWRERIKKNNPTATPAQLSSLMLKEMIHTDPTLEWAKAFI